VAQNRVESGILLSENQHSPYHTCFSRHKRPRAVSVDRAIMLSLKSSKLLSLPRESRDKIWEYTIADEAGVFVLQPGMTLTQFFYPKVLPPIAFIRCSHFAEVFLIWVRTRSFEFRFNTMIPPSFVWWMDIIGGGRAWANIKRMSFTTAMRTYQPGFGAGIGASNAADIVARGTTIRHLTLTISSLPVVRFDANTGAFTHVRPMGELLAAFDLRNILRCERLQSLTLLCCPTWKGDRCIEADDLCCAPQDLFLPLCNWFWHAFRDLGRTVTIKGRLERRGKKFSTEPQRDWG
jgi:hypothetical protein